MKAIKLMLASAAVLLSVTAFSQTDTTTGKTNTTAAKDTTTAQIQNQSSGQSQTGITSNEPAAPKPNFGRYYIPVLGTYQPAQALGSKTQSVTVTPDESNAGKVWVEGLTPEKFYAILKTAPATYKVPAQQQDKTSLKEGMITYDDNSKQITICLGCGFTESTTAETIAPDTHATVAKGKNKTAKPVVISFSGTKTEQGTAGTR